MNVKKNSHVSNYLKTYIISDKIRKLGAKHKKLFNPDITINPDLNQSIFLQTGNDDEDKDDLFDITNSRRFNILGINSLNKRGRMSIIVNNPERGKFMFTLYVKGDFDSMKNCMNLSKKDMISYNQIGRMYRSKGLVPIVYAMRLLTQKEILEYVDKSNTLLNNFSTMRNSTGSKLKKQDEK